MLLFYSSHLLNSFTGTHLNISMSSAKNDNFSNFFSNINAFLSFFSFSLGFLVLFLIEGMRVVISDAFLILQRSFRPFMISYYATWSLVVYSLYCTKLHFFYTQFGKVSIMKKHGILSNSLFSLIEKRWFLIG